MTRGKKHPRKAVCALCGAALAASPYADLFLHTESPTCKVVVTDNLGVSLDDKFVVEDGNIYAVETSIASLASAPVETGTGAIMIDGVLLGAPDLITGYVSVDSVAKKLFESVGEAYFGGGSGSRGWSSVSTYQRCPYLWKDKYGSGKSIIPTDAPGPPALETGSLTHLFLAVHYLQRINPLFPLDPEQVKKAMEVGFVDPAIITLAWELFDGYRAYWGVEDWMRPLAVEELAVDPRTGFSCRWDLIFEVIKPFENMLPGVYVCNSKTSATNSMVTRDQWQNDGQILGEIDLYERLGYHRRFGPLRAACINLLIKTKTPQYLRSFVYPNKRVLRDHHKTLKIWDAQMKLSEATGVYPRSRAACVTKYQGFCELFQHCAGGDADEPREIEA